MYKHKVKMKGKNQTVTIKIYKGNVQNSRLKQNKKTTQQQ